MKTDTVAIQHLLENRQRFVYPFISAITYGPVKNNGSRFGMTYEPRQSNVLPVANVDFRILWVRW